MEILKHQGEGKKDHYVQSAAEPRNKNWSPFALSEQGESKSHFQLLPIPFLDQRKSSQTNPISPNHPFLKWCFFFFKSLFFDQETKENGLLDSELLKFTPKRVQVGGMNKSSNQPTQPTSVTAGILLLTIHHEMLERETF